ncbi:MAG: hypothetical protein OXH46_11630 [Gemmatimonadetes bacterium]|nr:hypothetical protein [Gemmatimonadota bacterium]
MTCRALATSMPYHAVPNRDSRPGRGGAVKSATAITFALLVSASSLGAQAREFQLVEESRLGRAEGSGPDVFGDIHDLAVDSSGRIYVLDPGWRDVRLFDRDGQFIRRLAPEGEGPGERRHRRQFPARLTWDEAGGRLWIDDSAFLSILDSLGEEYARDTRIPSFLPGTPDPVSVVVAVDKEGRVYEQQFRVVNDSTYSYIARGPVTPDYTLSGDTLQIDVRATAQDGPAQTRRTSSASSRGSIVLTVIRPERDHIAWTISPEGTVWLAPPGEPVLHELTMSGDTLRTIDIPHRDPPELDVSPEGWVWARRAADSNGSTWDLLDDCGVYLGSASVPYPVDVTEVGPSGVIHAVASDPLGIDYVMTLRLDADVSRRSC